MKPDIFPANRTKLCSPTRGRQTFQGPGERSPETLSTEFCRALHNLAEIQRLYCRAASFREQRLLAQAARVFVDRQQMVR
jgi:hypothetical protein